MAIHAKADATGNNDGTSWEDAFTSLASVAPDTDDTVLLDGMFREALPLISGKSNVTIDGSQGPSGYSRLLGQLQLEVADLTDEGSGVWSFALASTPPTVTYDYKQDDAAGTVTGVTMEYPELVQAFSGLRLLRPEIKPYYGHLARASTFTTTSPAEGEWSYTGGRVYFNPPGSPAASEVAAKVAYGTLDRGVYLNGCASPKIYNIQTAGFGNPATQRGSFYLAGCTNIDMDNCISWDAGYRSFNIEGSTGNTNPLGHRVRRCFAFGDCIIGSTENYPFVIYNQQGCPNADCVFEDCTIVMYPWLGTAGRPIKGSTSGQTAMSEEYKPCGFYSHAGGGGDDMGGITFKNLTFISTAQMLNAKHNATSALGMFWPLERVGTLPLGDTAVFDTSEWANYPIKVDGGLIFGSPGQHASMALKRVRVIIPRPQGGLANYYGATVGVNGWIIAAGAGVYSYYYESCEMLFRRKNSALSGVWQQLNSANEIHFIGSTVVCDFDNPGFDSDCVVRNTVNSIIVAKGTLFASVGPGTGNAGFEGNNRHFLRLNGSNVAGDYPSTAYSGLTIEACWFYGFASGGTFYRNGAISDAVAGRSWTQFQDNAGGSPVNAEGLFVTTTDPQLNGFVSYAEGSPSNDITPLPGGALETTLMSPEFADLVGIVGIDRGEYAGRYGARHGEGIIKHLVSVG
jgi:hypothetical protein